MQPTQVFLPGKFHGQRSLLGYSPWSRKLSNMSAHTRQQKTPAVRLFLCAAAVVITITNISLHTFVPKGFSHTEVSLG